MTTTRPRRPARVSGALLNQRTTSSSGAVIAAAIVIRRSSCRLALAAILAQDHWRMKRRPERADSSREAGFAPLRQNGRASCRERVCQYVEKSVVAVSLKKKKDTEQKKN